MCRLYCLMCMSHYKNDAKLGWVIRFVKLTVSCMVVIVVDIVVRCDGWSSKWTLEKSLILFLMVFFFFMQHPEFIADPNGYPFDLALIKLSESAVNTSAVEPIDLAGDLNETFVGKECWIIGWGKTISK